MTTERPSSGHGYAWFSLPKRGNPPEEYEDAHAGDPQRGRFAIADGASDSICAGPWARILVDAFVRQPITSATELDVWTTALRPRWDAEVAEMSLPWYAKAKLKDGAYSTFLGLLLGPDGRWRATAVGDSCLFHLREGQLLTAFPLQHPEEFGTHPWLIGSRPPRPAGAVPDQTKALDIDHRWEPGDLFLLMTDALAEWFLSRSREDEPPLPTVRELLRAANRPDLLAGLIDHLQDDQQLHNDDTTLMAITP